MSEWIDSRVYLADVLPIDIPVNIKVELTRKCNFKCVYCYHGVQTTFTAKDIRNSNPMTIDFFEKFVTGWLKGWQGKRCKSITFGGLGEPLLNNSAAAFIKMSKLIAAESILITNGSLMTKKVIDELIDAELDTVRISLQGLNEEDYKKIGGAHIKFDMLLENILYFFKHKTKTKIWCKIQDIAVSTEEKQQKFSDLFKSICDETMIMSTAPLYSKEAYYNKTIYTFDDPADVAICPLPFFTLYLLPDGSVQPCSGGLDREGLSVGDINKESIYDIWHSKTFNEFRLKILTKTYKNLSLCNACQHPIYFNHKYDNIDSIKDKLLEYYKTDLKKGVT